MATPSLDLWGTPWDLTHLCRRWNRDHRATLGGARLAVVRVRDNDARAVTLEDATCGTEAYPPRPVTGRFSESFVRDGPPVYEPSHRDFQVGPASFDLSDVCRLAKRTKEKYRVTLTTPDGNTYSQDVNTETCAPKKIVRAADFGSEEDHHQRDAPSSSDETVDDGGSNAWVVVAVLAIVVAVVVGGVIVWRRR